MLLLGRIVSIHLTGFTRNALVLAQYSDIGRMTPADLPKLQAAVERLRTGVHQARLENARKSSSWWRLSCSGGNNWPSRSGTRWRGKSPCASARS